MRYEDHLGAVHWLWPRLKAPVYATPFTAFLLREKLRDARLLDEVSITEVPLGGKFSIGPFDLEMITLTHSIPEPNGLAIKTPLGTILHTGDWKIDPDPQLGEATDIDAIRKLGDEGILAMVCDSTNVFVDGVAGSEADVRVAMNKLISGLTGKIAVACFASNVARMDTVIRAAQAAGRKVCLAGRSMHRMSAAARSVGLLVGDRALHHRRSGQVPARERSPVPLHRQPGRGEGGPVAYRRRHPSACEAVARRPRGLQLAGHSGQRNPDPQPAEQAGRPRRTFAHRTRHPRHPRQRAPVP